MGLLDSVAGAVLGKVMGGNKGMMAQVALDMFNRNGGIGGLMEKFNAGGLGDAASSWVGKGENAPVSADQIGSVLGSDMIAEMAAKFGIDANDLTGQLAEHLPEVVNQATPDGEVNDKSNDLLTSIFDMLK